MVPSANRFVPASCFSLCDTVALWNLGGG
jgi:hypothetical protein